MHAEAHELIKVLEPVMPVIVVELCPLEAEILCVVFDINMLIKQIVEVSSQALISGPASGLLAISPIYRAESVAQEEFGEIH
jgi:hypothetical protein